MQSIILDIMSNFGYIGVFLLITLENIFPPIPSELILTFGGFMTLAGNLNIWGVILSSTLGSVMGAVVLYALGGILNKERLERLISSRFGKVLRLKKEDIKKTDKWFERYGFKAVLLCRFIPIVRSLISIPAGIAKMDIKKFLLFTALGTLVWNTVLVYLGRLAGEAWEKVNGYLDLYTAVSGVLLTAAILVLSIVLIKRGFRRKA